MTARPRALCVFVDALGPRQLARLSERAGVPSHTRALRGVLGYSSGALPTVLTGAAPAVHGRMCLFSRREEGADSLLSPLRWLGLLPRIVHERAGLRRVVGEAFARARGLTGYLQLARVPPEAFRWLDVPEREDLFRASTIGGAPTFLADAREAGLSVLAARWQDREDERWTAALSSLESGPPDLAFLYATELDGLLHARGNTAGEVEGVLDRLGARIARAREAMSQGGAELCTIVVGDHGMADVREVIDPRPLLRALPPRHFVDSTMLRVWGTPAELARTADFLARRVPGRWLDREALALRDAPTARATFGDGVWLLPEGWIFAPSFLGGVVRGMHGYDLDASSALAGFATDDAAVAGRTHHLTDVAREIRVHLGLS